MAEEPEEGSGGRPIGILMEDRDGNIYLIRKEILEVAQIPSHLAQDAKERLSAGVKSIGPDSTLCGAGATGFTVVAGVNIEELYAT